MDSFYMIVVLIAVILLILCLTGVGILMGYQDANLVFPPKANNCPDGWTTVGNVCTVPTAFISSTTGLTATQGFTAPVAASGSTPEKLATIDFSKDYWANICEKKKWANKFNINWDGVSNYNKC
jgi:hypothetical protein